MSLTLGEKLRQAREEQGISISEVAENTRISPHYIKSIEEDNYKPLPGGIFNKGFIKSYARYLGVDENEALQDYADMIASQTEAPPVPPHAYRPEVLTDERYSESRAPTIIFAAVILAVMTIGVLLLVRFLQNRSEATTANAVVSANTNSNTAGQTSPIDQAPAPAAPDKISIQLRAEGAPVWVSYSVDNNHKIQTLGANETLTIEPNQSFSISYSKAKLDTLKVAVNGKDVAVPNDSTKGTVDFSIDRSNVQDIIQSGQLKSSSPSSATTPSPRPSPKATPKSSVSPKPSTSPKPSSANANRR